MAGKKALANFFSPKDKNRIHTTMLMQKPQQNQAFKKSVTKKN